MVVKLAVVKLVKVGVFVEAIVILSFVASGVNVILLPASIISSSVLLSALIAVLPTVTLLNASWLTSALASIPDNLSKDASIS